MTTSTIASHSPKHPSIAKRPPALRASTTSLVATGGGLLFGGDTNGRFKAFDQNTGEVLWEVNIGSPVTGYPIAYAVDGRQYVAVSTGTSATPPASCA